MVKQIYTPLPSPLHIENYILSRLCLVFYICIKKGIYICMLCYLAMYSDEIVGICILFYFILSSPAAAADSAAFVVCVCARFFVYILSSHLIEGLKYKRKEIHGIRIVSYQTPHHTPCIACMHTMSMSTTQTTDSDFHHINISNSHHVYYTL